MGIETFNAEQTNDTSKFNATMEDSRQKFYQNMQYNIDLANARWRQTVTLQEDQQNFEAAAIDVRNLVGISSEQLNQIWDRSDALLDYIWKTSDNDKQRNHELVLSQMRIDAGEDARDDARDAETTRAIGSLVGTVVSPALQKGFGKVIDSVFSF